MVDSVLSLRGLYAITPDDADTLHLLDRVKSVLTAKPALLQYRNKSASPALQEAQAYALATLCRDADVPLIINDNAALALQVGAAGVHLGVDDGALDDARATLGPAAIIGVSCYGSLLLAEQAEARGATYVAFGSVFASSTKPNAEQINLSVLEEARRRLRVPICAIGGIERRNAAPLIAMGVDLVAVISDVFDDPQPALAAMQFGRLFPRS
ncbi:MAG: thiamine phosphate synthase [Pseudomarimonas sp.]